MQRYSIVFIAMLLCITGIHGQQVSIAPYYGRRQAALSLTITPHCPLDAKLYHHPLTIVIDSKQMVDINPHGGPVSVRICSAQHQSEP